MQTIRMDKYEIPLFFPILMIDKKIGICHFDIFLYKKIEPLCTSHLVIHYFHLNKGVNAFLAY